MPYFRDPNEEQQQQDQSNVQLGSGGVQVGPDGQASDPKQASPTGSKFTNLDSYLNNNDSKGFGQQFGQKIEGGITEAKQTVDSTRDQINGQINAYQTPTDQQIKGVVENAGKGTTDQQVKDYNAWTAQTYQGPKSLQDNQEAWSRYHGAVDKADTEAKLSSKEPGRFALLDQYFGRPSYNFGEKSLDNLLIQGGGGFTNSKELQEKAAGLKGYAATQEKDISDQAAKKAGQVDESRKLARQSIGLDDNGQVIGGPLADLKTAIGGRVTAANTARDKALDHYRTDLADDTFDPDTERLLQGAVRGDMHLFDLDLSKYVKDGGVKADQFNMATPEEVSRYLALSQLAGQTPDYLTPDKAASAGTYKDSIGFDADAFKRDAALKQRQYDLDQDTPQYKISGLLPSDKGHLSAESPVLSLNQMRKYIAGNHTAGMGWDDPHWAGVREMVKYLEDYDKAHNYGRTLGKSPGAATIVGSKDLAPLISARPPRG